MLIAFFAVSFFAHAQPGEKVPRIGYLTISSRASTSARTEAFRQGLRELGYVEGKNIVIEWRSGEGRPERVDALAAELVARKIDVIVTGGSGATHRAKNATRTIPIVMAQDRDPVGNGFVASLARPAGNITGLSTLSPEISGKQLDILKEVIPKLSRVGVLANLQSSAYARVSKEVELAAAGKGVQLQYLNAQSSNDIDAVFRAATQGRSDAILVVGGPALIAQRKHVSDLAVKSRLPAIYDQRDYVEAGGLMTYGVNLPDLDRRAATYVDKILKGAKPADLPVEQPTQFELVINLKAAKQIGLTIPPNVLARADRVIK
jgi:putative ABC transport system substrate-binding protein